MRKGRSAAAGLLAGVLALSLVAAETPPAEGEGTASTRLLGADATVTGLGDGVSARLLDVITSAETEGVPSALTEIVPIRVGDDAYGETGASSDGTTQTSSDSQSFADPLGLLGLSIAPVSTTATATADRALATVGAATGQLGALLGDLGLDLESTGITSMASRDEAAATQGMTVSGLSLGLADLGLDTEVLGQLGLDNVLELLGALPGLLPEGTEGVDDVLALIDDLESQLGLLETEGSPILDGLTDLGTQLGAIEDVLPQVEILDELLTTLQGLLSLDLLDLLDALGDADLTSSLPLDCALPGGLDLLDLAALLDVVDETIDCVTGELSDIGLALSDAGVSGISGDPSALLAELTAAITTLLGTLPADLSPVLDVVDQVTSLVQQILDELAGLPGLLEQLPGLLAEAAETDLLSISAFDVGTTAIAGETLGDSSATVLCDAVDVVILGTAHETPDCSDALEGLAGVTATISGAVDQVADVLNTLPLGELVQVGELRVDLFTDLVESVTEEDGKITAVAGFNLLDLAIPSITLDPSQVTAPLGDLGLPVGLLDDVTAILEGLEGELGGLTEVLGGLGELGLDVPDLSALVDPLDDALALVGAEGTLTGLVAQVEALLAELDLGDLDLGSLTEEISTPGLELLIDPQATATFVAGTATETPAPAPAPAPAPETPEAPAPAPSKPTLPSTGGGLALLGVLAMAGAAALRRREG